MQVDPDRVRSKTAYIHEQVEALRSLTKMKGMEEILADPWLMKGIKYSLQTAIEAMIDLAYHVNAKKLGHAPGDARDAFYALIGAGIISKEDFETYSAMIGLRNRIGHGYETVSGERIYALITQELDDFYRFTAQMAKLVEQG